MTSIPAASRAECHMRGASSRSRADARAFRRAAGKAGRSADPSAAGTRRGPGARAGRGRRHGRESGAPSGRRRSLRRCSVARREACAHGRATNRARAPPGGREARRTPRARRSARRSGGLLREAQRAAIRLGPGKTNNGALALPRRLLARHAPGCAEHDPTPRRGERPPEGRRARRVLRCARLPLAPDVFNARFGFA